VVVGRPQGLAGVERLFSVDAVAPPATAWCARFVTERTLVSQMDRFSQSNP
jgi:hypothetical protein